ncbi:putative porin [Flocculibacter collagenilyticus]|uniref:putative porin n=1 Tax=Flocculibacter collagenilyticus TaxID=2744479 RepID=UPI0018F34538|nr:putative porin [Flocculibacter collagenilyticus]
MKKTHALLVIAALSASAAQAEQYRSFSTASYHDSDYNETFGLSSQYFFGDKKTLGPLDQFGYINDVSTVYGNYNHSSDDGFIDYNSNTYNVGGEYFTNQFILGLDVKHANTNGNTGELVTATLGYEINDDWQVRLQYLDGENGFDEVLLSTNYNHQINQTDYIGFTLVVDDEFDNANLSTKYFSDLGQDKYLQLTASVDHSDDFSDSWAVGGKYYFNKMTGVSLNAAKDDHYSAGVSHFFTKNIGVSFEYTTVGRVSDDMFGITATAQF